MRRMNLLGWKKGVVEDLSCRSVRDGLGKSLGKGFVMEGWDTLNSSISPVAGISIQIRVRSVWFDTVD